MHLFCLRFPCFARLTLTWPTSTPPPSKRPKTNPGVSSPPRSAGLLPSAAAASSSSSHRIPAAPSTILDTNPPPAPNPRKRPASRSPATETRQLDLKPPPTNIGVAESGGSASVSIPALLSEDTGAKKKSRTNTPWTAAEEQRLKRMRDSGNTWSEIAKVRTASVLGRHC